MTECNHVWKDNGVVRGDGAPYQYCDKCKRVSILGKARTILRRPGEATLDEIVADYAKNIKVTRLQS